MAYLTECLSNQELTVTTASDNAISADNDIDVLLNSAEARNSQISRRLKVEKTRLINALSHFPATALWLLNEYQQNDILDDQDDEPTLKADLTSTLADIKQHYQLLTLTLANKGMHTSAYADAKLALTTVLQQFPFSFSDLTKLVDMVVYAYKFRGFCYQPATRHQSNPQVDLIIKRLEGIERRGRLNTPKLADLFKATELNELDEQFLFLSSNDMQKYFTEMVFAEHFWLKTRQQLASANAKLVLFIANQYKAGFLDFDDLVQEGHSGLLKAVDKFDHRLGFQFSTYAGYWIRQAISRSLSRCERVVRVPCGQVATINRVYRAKDELIAKTGKEPSVKELAEYTKLSDHEINTILSISQASVPLDGAEDNEDTFAPIDFLEQQIFTHPIETIAKTDLKALLSKAIEILNPREAKIICSHFGVDSDREMTLQEIGAELNLTRERVRQIQVIALNKIRLNYGQQLMYFLS